MQHGDRVVQLSGAVTTQQAELRKLLGQRQALAHRKKQEELQLTQAEMQRSKFEQQFATVEASLNSVGIVLFSEAPEQIQSLAVQFHEEVSSAAAAALSARQVLQTAEVALASAQASCQALDEQKQATEATQNDVQKRLTELHDLTRKGTVNLASGLQALTEAERATEDERAATSAAARTANEQFDNQKVVQATAKAAVTAARTSHQQASQAWTEHRTRMESLLSALRAAKFDNDVSTEQLRQQVEVAAARQVTALGLRDRVAELEVAIDTAATSAAFENIRQRILANDAVVQEATVRAQKVKPWVGYFADVKSLLSAQQANATDHFITEYGPRTAVIQQRLRPVYGFGEIEVSSKDSAISIGVHRKGETLRPTDFFSQSQVQTLVLGLFLTACSSQTWSGFSSIMMDDPVTHFDDLNTYALLDLILGLQSSPEGERQFVISTCDEKLLQLARHKFRHMGPAARFYRFQAIGAEGPMVSEISGH